MIVMVIVLFKMKDIISTINIIIIIVIILMMCLGICAMMHVVAVFNCL